jgi:hypothetical protein
MGLVPIVSVSFAIIFRGHWLAGPVAGFTYALYSPIMFIHGKKVDRDRAKLSHLNDQQEPISTPA